MKEKLSLVLGLFLLGAAGLWQMVLSPHWTQRLPPGWRWQANYLGSLAFPDPKTGQFPPRDTLNIYDREITIIDESQRPKAVFLEDRFTIYELKTRKVTWEYIVHFRVDPQTGAHLDLESRGDVAVFPRYTEKTTYPIRFNYIKGLPLQYEGEEQIEGLTTFLFAYRGRAEYTESYLGSPSYPGVPVKPGQEIKCADDQFSVKFWVEPVTGEIVQSEEDGSAGDYIYDVATGQQLAPVCRWEGFTQGDDVANRAQRIRQQRTVQLWTRYYLGLLLLGSGTICLLFGAARRLLPRHAAAPLPAPPGSVAGADPQPGRTCS
jgi:hypothetical protein